MWHASISLGFSAPPNPADHVLFPETSSPLSYPRLQPSFLGLARSHTRPLNAGIPGAGSGPTRFSRSSLTIITSTPMTPNTAQAGHPLLSSKLLAYQAPLKKSPTSQTKAARNLIDSFNVRQIPVSKRPPAADALRFLQYSHIACPLLPQLGTTLMPLHQVPVPHRFSFENVPQVYVCLCISTTLS